MGGTQVLVDVDRNFQVLAMLGESLVPKPARHFFNVVSDKMQIVYLQKNLSASFTVVTVIWFRQVRRRLMEQSGRGEDSCSSTYTCSLVSHGEEEEINQFEMSSMNPR